MLYIYYSIRGVSSEDDDNTDADANANADEAMVLKNSIISQTTTLIFDVGRPLFLFVFLIFPFLHVILQ